MDTFIFVIERVDGSRLVIGHGTLDAGKMLIERIEADFAAKRPVPTGYEGCNVVAVLGDRGQFMFVR
jgi:hypothetical protein